MITLHPPKEPLVMAIGPIEAGDAEPIEHGRSFSRWLANARPGHICIYARATYLPIHPPSFNRHVQEAAIQGKIFLLQRRLGDFTYDYFAVRTFLPELASARFVWAI